MADAVKLRIKERRRMELSGVLNYLHNPKQDHLSAETSSIFSILYKTVIKKQVKAIIEKLDSADNAK